jgi:hypothetical protein
MMRSSSVEKAFCRNTYILSAHLKHSVRTQFSKDDVDASDSLLAGLFDDDFNGDDGVWVD